MFLTFVFWPFLGVWKISRSCDCIGPKSLQIHISAEGADDDLNLRGGIDSSGYLLIGWGDF